MTAGQFNPEEHDSYEDYLSSLSHLELEEEADRILADQRRETTRKHTEMRDYLSIGQLKTRWSREIYNSTGVAEESFVSGIVRRAYVSPREGGPRDLRDEL